MPVKMTLQLLQIIHHSHGGGHHAAAASRPRHSRLRHHAPMSGSVSTVSRRSGGHLAAGGGGSGKLAMRRSHSLDAENPAAAAGGSAVYSTVNVEAVPSGHVYKQLFDAGVSNCCSECVVSRFRCMIMTSITCFRLVVL